MTVTDIPKEERVVVTENCCRLLEKELRGLTELRPIETAPRDGMRASTGVQGEHEP